jgi:hypothetical protein
VWKCAEEKKGGIRFLSGLQQLPGMPFYPENPKYLNGPNPLIFVFVILYNYNLKGMKHV